MLPRYSSFTDFQPEAGSRIYPVIVSSGDCQWSASLESPASWVTFSPATGTGTGQINVTVEALPRVGGDRIPCGSRTAYIKVRNQASRYALVGVFVARRPSDVRVAVTGAGSDGVFRATAFEEALKKRFSHKVLDGISASADGLNSDLHGSAEYRAHLIAVLARRAVEAATGKA